MKKQRPDLTDDFTTEQSKNNPAFDSDGTTSPSGDHLSTQTKPTATVRPTRFSKPKPAERCCNAQSTHDDRLVPPSSPPTSINDGNLSLENMDDCPYAQASVTMGSRVAMATQDLRITLSMLNWICNQTRFMMADTILNQHFEEMLYSSVQTK